MPFDPYHKWLGIPAKEQPPSHYRLLGVSPSESDGDVISASADQRMNYLYQFTKGEHAADAQRVMDEIARASMCLLDPIQAQSLRHLAAGEVAVPLGPDGHDLQACNDADRDR